MKHRKPGASQKSDLCPAFSIINIKRKRKGRNMEEKIVLFGLEEKYVRQIQKIAANYGVDVIKAQKDSYAGTVGQAVGTEPQFGKLSYKGKPPKKSLLLFSDVSKMHFETILEELRRQEIPIDLKAITTPTNVKWNVMQLYMELEREKSNMIKNRGK